MNKETNTPRPNGFALVPFAVFAADGDDSDGWYPAAFSETKSGENDRFINDSLKAEDFSKVVNYKNN